MASSRRARRSSFQEVRQLGKGVERLIPHPLPMDFGVMSFTFLFMSITTSVASCSYPRDARYEAFYGDGRRLFPTAEPSRRVPYIPLAADDLYYHRIDILPFNYRQALLYPLAHCNIALCLVSHTITGERQRNESQLQHRVKRPRNFHLIPAANSLKASAEARDHNNSTAVFSGDGQPPAKKYKRTSFSHPPK